MGIFRLNHVVLYVRDVEISRTFYQEVLGFTVIHNTVGRACFLQAPGSTNDHDIGLFGIGTTAGASEAGRQTVGMYHIAWEVATLGELITLRDDLQRRGNLVGATDHSATKSLYAMDPDGLEFEVCWIVPKSLLTDEILEGRRTNQPLNLEGEIERFGATTRGGLGVSVPLGVSVDA